MQSDSNTTTMNDSKWSGVKRGIKRTFFVILTLFLVCSCFFIYARYFYTYSDGYRAGLLQKFSHKGNLIKTYEGEMILSSVIGNSNVAIASEKFYFSVTDKKLADQLDTIQGQMVIVHYLQKNGSLFWHGESPYLVDGVKRKP